MDYKLEYMERLFAKISKKKTESYAISRIWHQLDDDRVKFVVQQYVRIDKDKYALADLYLPQLNIFIEINEPFHENNIERDKLRNEKIMDITHSELCTIVCGTKTKDQDGKEVIHWKPLDEIHRQITEVVSLIKQRISELGENFKPWDDVSTLSVEYHRNKGYLRVEDNECLRTVDDVAAVFGTKPKHRGFLRASGAGVPNKKGWIIWWPNTNHTRWCNEPSPDGMYIYEYPTKENKSVTQVDHLKQWLAAPEETRVTFLRYKDDLGFCFYRFVGVFRLNKEKSVQENKCVWERVSDTYQLNV
jgi:very-short-patch-repair endonuclease